MLPPGTCAPFDRNRTDTRYRIPACWSLLLELVFPEPYSIADQCSIVEPDVMSADYRVYYIDQDGQELALVNVLGIEQWQAVLTDVDGEAFAIAIPKLLRSIIGNNGIVIIGNDDVITDVIIASPASPP